MNHWLMKSELDVYPYAQLVADGQTHWDGVRNYQARNTMRDAMKKGDLILYYHSNTIDRHAARFITIYFNLRKLPDGLPWSSQRHHPISSSKV